MQERLNHDEEMWRRLDWNDVRIFLAVAETGSLNAASRLLGTSQPTISRRMEVLEATPQRAPVLRARSRGVQLTGRGRHHAGVWRQGWPAWAGHDRSRCRPVVIATTPGGSASPQPDGVASYLLVPMLAEFQRANPQIEVVLDCGLWPGSMESGDTDLAIEFHESAPADVVSTPLATLHYALHASQDYLSTYGTPTSFAELVEHRIVRHTAYREQRSHLEPQGPGA